MPAYGRSKKREGENKDLTFLYATYHSYGYSIVYYICDEHVKHILVKRSPNVTYYDERKFVKEFVSVFLDDKLDYRYMKSETISKMCKTANGHDISVLSSLCKKMIDRHDRYLSDRKSIMTDWENLREQFDNYVIGLDKEIDVYDSGFSVRILMSSSNDFEKRKAFVKEQRNEIIEWTIQELEKKNRFIKRIGDLTYYKPAEITILRTPNIDIKFELKATPTWAE